MGMSALFCGAHHNPPPDIAADGLVEARIAVAEMQVQVLKVK